MAESFDVHLHELLVDSIGPSRQDVAGIIGETLARSRHTLQGSRYSLD